MTSETNKQAVNAAKPSSSRSKNRKALKPKAKIKKESAPKANIGKEPEDNNGTKSTKSIDSTQLKGKRNKKKIKIASEGSNAKQDEKKLNLIKLKEKADASKEQIVNDQQTAKPKEKHVSLQNEQKKQKKKEDKRASDSAKRKNEMNKEKRTDTEKSVHREKKNIKPCGHIFMCSAKTKPDCFRYRVMGVSLGKKDLVLAIKPGTKLFLYDFDLRLLYGVYKASSTGGLQLEPTAFNGAFPAQVRFTVHQDCYPLPENVFKKAIRENYNDRNKFDTELNFNQVKKLVELFQPADFVPKAPAINTQPVVVVEGREPYQRHSIRPLEDDLHLSREKEEFRGDTFLSEEEYRTYGLRRERPERLPPVLAPHVPEPYIRTHVIDHGLRHPPASYRDIPAPVKESISHPDVRSLNERDYQTYGISPRIELQHPVSIPPVTSASGSIHDPYYSRYGSLALDQYQVPTRRDELASASYYPGTTLSNRELYPIETDTLTRRESHFPPLTDSTHLLGRRASYLTEYDSLKKREYDDVGRLQTASGPLVDYNPTRYYQEPRSEASQVPVSSRYSFAGPSTLYR